MYCWRTRRDQVPYILVLLVTVLLSCESEKPPAMFYPIDSLVADQIAHLAEINARLFKETLLSGKTDTITYTPSDTAWRKELDIFSKLNEINKPVNKTSYEVSDGLLDPGSNLTVKAFTALKDLPIVYLKIYYQGTLSKPRKIEALYDEGNVLYKSTRELSMHFQQVDNETVLTSYSVRGGQKLVFGDSVNFIISGKVLIN